MQRLRGRGGGWAGAWGGRLLIEKAMVARPFRDLLVARLTGYSAGIGVHPSTWRQASASFPAQGSGVPLQLKPGTQPGVAAH